MTFHDVSWRYWALTAPQVNSWMQPERRRGRLLSERLLKDVVRMRTRRASTTGNNHMKPILNKGASDMTSGKETTGIFQLKIKTKKNPPKNKKNLLWFWFTPFPAYLLVITKPTTDDVVGVAADIKKRPKRVWYCASCLTRCTKNISWDEKMRSLQKKNLLWRAQNIEQKWNQSKTVVNKQRGFPHTHPPVTSHHVSAQVILSSRCPPTSRHCTHEQIVKYKQPQQPKYEPQNNKLFQPHMTLRGSYSGCTLCRKG